MKTEPNDIINALEEVDGSGGHYHTHYGLTKREHFAALAMASYYGGEYIGQSGMPYKDIAANCVLMADALITALNETAPC